MQTLDLSQLPLFSKWERIDSKVRILGDCLKDVFPQIVQTEIYAMKSPKGSFTVYIDHKRHLVIVPPGGINIDEKQKDTGGGKEIQVILEHLATVQKYSLIACITKKGGIKPHAELEPILKLSGYTQMLDKGNVTYRIHRVSPGLSVEVTDMSEVAKGLVANIIGKN